MKKNKPFGELFYRSLKKNLEIMRNAIIILFFGILQANAIDSYSQKTRLSFNFSETELVSVLDRIEQESEFFFLYNEKLLETNRKVSISANDELISSILDNLFQDTDVRYTIVDRKIILAPEYLSGAPQPQQKQITGTVTDKNGPIPGVNVVVTGTTQGTITDLNGKYIIPVSPGSESLTFTFIGMQSQVVNIGTSNQIDVTLTESAIGLDEVVVVGYGTQKKVNLTGSIEQINTEDIATRPSPNITTALQGLMPGLNIKPNTGDPRSTPEINIRGFNSLNGGNPLVLVDGIEGQMELINPSDIESITILKDAGSSAIYGARGAFGVILVTTKQGKEGDIKVNYNYNSDWTTPTARTDFISDPYLYAKTVDAGIFGYNGGSFTQYNENDWETIKKVSRGELEPFYETLPNGNKKFFFNTNWHDYLFKKWQPSQNHNISFSGGSKRLKGYFSGRYYNTSDYNNIAPGDMSKYNLKGSLSFQVTDWLEVSGNTQINRQDEIEYGGANTGFGGYLTASTYLTYYVFQPNFLDGKSYHNSQGNAAAMEDKKSWRTRDFEQFINTVNVKLTPIDGLVVNFDYSNRINHRSVATRLNKFDFYSGTRAILVTQGLNRLAESRERNNFNVINLYGTYAKSLGDHNFKLMLGYNQEDYISNYIVGEHGDLLYPDLSNFSLGTNIINLSGEASSWAVQGYFGRFNYDFKNRYLIEVNARRDGSSRFPDDSRWGFFPSVSAGWFISREEFWNPLENIVNSFKLRTSYGKLGNQNVDLYTFSQTLNNSLTTWLFNGSRSNYVGSPSPLPSRVTWEETTSIDFGADFGFLNNKLQASFDWYEKRTQGMYVSGQPLPAVFGASEPRENIAGLSNRGFEVSMSFNDEFDLRGSPLRLRTTFSVYNYVATITDYPNPEGLMSSYWEGQKLGQIWGYRIEGQFQTDEEARAYYNSFNNPKQSLGQVYYLITNARNIEWNTLRAGDIKYLDIDGDGEISKGKYTLEDHGDLEVIGNAMPQFPFGFSISTNWKSFDLSLAGNGVANQDWTPGGVTYWGHYDRPQASFIRKDLVSQAWSPENPNGRYPQIYRGYTALGANRMLYEPNDYYLENVGYLRVKNLTFGYTLPQSLTKKIQVQNLRVYFSGENLVTWSFGGLTKYVDPAQAGSGIGFNNPGDATGRSLVEEYPYGKTYSFGINITL